MRRRLAPPEWLTDSALLLEAFVAINLAFLALDIYVAHSMNAFRHPAEWIPFYFSIAGAIAVVAIVGKALIAGARANMIRASGDRAAEIRAGDGAQADDGARAPSAASSAASAASSAPSAANAALSAAISTGAARWVGIIVGWASIAVGISGLLWHLQSHFFRAATLKNLVYSAPFIAPLAYAGVGFLLLANRLLPHRTASWARWVLFLAWGGWLGNFGLSLLDHAQNGFFYWTEWIPVAVSALAVGFVAMLCLANANRLLLALSAWILVLQAITGVLGLGLHLRPLLDYSTAPLFDRLVHGAPVFAPLLFVNLALLAGIGVWESWRQERAGGDIIYPTLVGRRQPLAGATAMPRLTAAEESE